MNQNKYKINMKWLTAGNQSMIEYALLLILDHWLILIQQFLNKA